MTLAALLLVLAAAILHAVWNLIAKRAAIREQNAREGGAPGKVSGLPFVTLLGATNLLLYAPVVAVFWWWKHPVISEGALLWIAGSGVLKTCYGLFLQRSYRTGEYSLVYPLARGTGPLLATSAAIAFFGERPGPVAVLGGLIIVAGIFVLAGGTRLFHQDRAHVRVAARYGAATGAFIAAYTLWDRRGVAGLGIAPVLYDAGTTVTTVLLLSPIALRRRRDVVAAWKLYRWHVVAVAGLSSLAYILVLTALAFTPVSYVAPAREISIVFGAFLGSRVLKEGEGRRRMWSALAIAAGILALAVG